MKISFTDYNEMITLPVTPSDFKIKEGVKIETISLTEIGDYIFGGHGTLESFSISSFFPAKDYYFATMKHNPYDYVNWILNRMYHKTVVRYIIEGTDINIPVLFEDIEYGEQDGTGDVYYSLTVRRYRYADSVAVKAEDVETVTSRSDSQLENQSEVLSYKIKSGDTLSKICRDKYGDHSLYPKLQKYNGLKTTVIFSGNILKIPPKSVLEGL